MARRGDGIYLRGKTWWLDFMHKGERHQVKIGRNINRTVAREIAQVLRAEIIKGNHGISKKKRDISFEKASEEFLKWVKANKKPRTLKCYGEFVTQLAKFLRGKRLSQIHPFLLEKYKLKRLQEGAKVSVNRELSVLKNIFNRMIEWKKYEGDNPVRKVKMNKETRGRTRFLEYDEEDRLLAAASEPMRTIILLGIYTGLRIGSEALTLKKPDVDLKRRRVTVQAAHAKNGETKTVPINSLLVEPLRAQMARSDSEWLFVKNDRMTPLREIKTAFYAACRRAKLSGVTPHVLRHTFASRLAMAGVDLRTIQELGGWKTITMVNRYAHLNEEHKTDAVELIASRNSTTLFTTLKDGEFVESTQVVEK